jgi:phosphate/sulfate permease
MPRLKTMKNPLLVYTLARLGIFSGILAILLLLNFAPIVAVIIASMLAFSFSLIFLRKLREASSAKIFEATNGKKKTRDENAED